MDNTHYVIFRKTDAHSAVWLAYASSLREAFIAYAVNEFATLNKSGLLVSRDEDENEIVYVHPVQAIELEEKFHFEWQIRELNNKHWEARLAEVFCSENPYSVKEYIAMCVPFLESGSATVNHKAFIWHLKEGPLVSFFGAQANATNKHKLEVVERFIIRWDTWPEVQRWSGSYDDILKNLSVTYPNPV